MVPERDLNDAMVWLEFAKSDLALARKGKLPGVRLGALCFHCQQAAEKSLKAVLLHHQVDFPPIHSLIDLFDLLPSPISAPPDVVEAARLTAYITKGRYPLDIVDIQQVEYKKTVQLAKRVLIWAEKIIRTQDKPGGPLLQEPSAVYKASPTQSRKLRKSRRTTKRK
jgi:HEPN domain-containing protein